MGVPIIQAPVRRWDCAHCSTRSTTRVAGPHTEFHNCPGQHGLSMPMTLEGSGSRTRLELRGDYVGDEMVRLDEAGRPVMAVYTDHPDGSYDCAVYAPTATSGSSA